MDEEKVEVKEYEVYFTTPDGKFLEGTKWCCSLIDSVPTSFFTIRTKKFDGLWDLDIFSKGLHHLNYTFDFNVVFHVANGDTFSAKEINKEYTFVYDPNQGWLLILDIKKIRQQDIILTIEFANQPVIK